MKLFNWFNYNKHKVYAIYGKKKISCLVLNLNNTYDYKLCGHEQDFIIGIYQNKYAAENITTKLNNKYNLHNGNSINYSKNIYCQFYVLEHTFNESFRTFI